MQATREIEDLKKKARGFARCGEARFLCGRKGRESLWPIRELKFAPDEFQRVMGRTVRSALEFE